jgi:hypothetical protein
MSEPTMSTTTARFDGVCDYCGDPWTPGMTIARSGVTDDQEFGWLHEGCARIVHDANLAEHQEAAAALAARRSSRSTR